MGLGGVPTGSQLFDQEALAELAAAQGELAQYDEDENGQLRDVSPDLDSGVPGL